MRLIPLRAVLAFSITVLRRTGRARESLWKTKFLQLLLLSIAIRFLTPLYPAEHGSVLESQAAGAPSFPRDINFSGSCRRVVPFFRYLSLSLSLWFSLSRYLLCFIFL